MVVAAVAAAAVIAVAAVVVVVVVAVAVVAVVGEGFRRGRDQIIGSRFLALIGKLNSIREAMPLGKCLRRDGSCSGAGSLETGKLMADDHWPSRKSNQHVS